MDVELGEEIGFQYRGSKLDNGKSSKSDKTKLLFSTDGSIVAQLINDPFLKAYDVVIIDEAHERQVNIDLLILLMKRALKLNDKLKLIIMSATLPGDLFINYFKKDGFKVENIFIEGETHYDVEDIFLPKVEKDYLAKGADIIVNDILKKNKEGDILMFVNSLSEAMDGKNLIERKLSKNTIENENPLILELGRGASPEVTKLVSNPELYKTYKNGIYTRRIIIATNQIESSATIDGLIFVLDCGYEFSKRYDPLKMQTIMMKSRISKAQTKQRKGRAGRTQPGICYKLYTKKEYEEFLDNPIVDIKKQDITTDLLRFLSIDYIQNIKNVKELVNELIEPPTEQVVNSSLHVLVAIGLINELSLEGTMTELGKIVYNLVKNKIPNPYIARALLISVFFNCSYEMSNVAAILDECGGRIELLFLKYRPDKKLDKAEQSLKRKEYIKIKTSFASSYGDIISLLKIYDVYKRKSEDMNKNDLQSWCKSNYLSFKSLQNILKTSKKIHKTLYSDKNTINALNFNRVNVELFEKHEDNIIHSLLMGYIVNYAKNISKYKYGNCFPIIKSDAILSDDSFLKLYKTTPTNVIYIELSDIFGSKSINIVSKISTVVLDRLKNIQKEYIKNCYIDNIKKVTNRKKFSGKKKKFSGKKKKFSGKKKKFSKRK